ncbi:unnamed protein product [Ostreobium quekettii]|uniref:Cytochrome P450 n=1 Tax=Ostreobium quekettii TaxID=121088 RepID=A0A8S1J7A5_9CHLO|nr:unnamed protein product [Ostreobium quekettii]
MGCSQLFGGHGHDSLFTAREMDSRWKSTRKGTSRAFSTEALKAKFPLVLKKANELVEIIRGTSADEAIDFQPLFVRFTLDTAGLVGYNIDFKALQNKHCPLFEALVYCSSEALASSANPCRGVVKRLFPSGKLAQECDKLYGQLYNEYDWILKELRGRGEPAADDHSLWACLMRLKDPETGVPLDDELLCPEVATFILAATDTTAHQAMWAMFAIAALPDVQRKIEAEIKGCGMFQRLRKGGVDRLTYSDITSLNYLTMVTKEAMRLFPSTSLGTLRCTTKDGERVCGYRVPKNTYVIACIHALFNAPWLWEHPEHFNPERWSNQARQEASEVDARSERKGATRSFWSFSDGPRDCIGQRLAMMELLSVMAVLLANFEFRLADKMGGWDGACSRQYNAMALAIDGGMWLQCHPRTDAA